LSSGTPAPTIEHPGRRHLTFLLAPVVAMIVAGYVADALWPTLVHDNPLLLISLSAKNRYLVLVVNQVSLWWYYVIGTLRLLLPDPFFFALGWFYGAAALRWMERRTPTVGRYMRTLEGWFGKWGAPLVFLFPNNYVCLIAGAAGMSPWLFAALNVTGTLGRLLMLEVIGDIFAGPITSILDFVGHWRIPLLVISIAFVLLASLGELRRGRQEIAALHELEDAADEIELGHHPEAVSDDAATDRAASEDSTACDED
jgi:membrane protein DedA with SNARE-associated domain